VNADNKWSLSFISIKFFMSKTDDTSPEIYIDSQTIVVGLVAIFVIIAVSAQIIIPFLIVNPAKQMAVARNARRSIDVQQILEAITIYSVEKNYNVNELNVSVCPGWTVIGTQSRAMNLSEMLVDEYLVAVPMDPLIGTEENTGYSICKTSSGRLHINALGELGKDISVSR